MKRPKKKTLATQEDLDAALEAGHDALDGAGSLLDDDEHGAETARTIERPRIHSRRPRRTSLLAAKQEDLEAFYTRLPEPGESLHIVSNGTFDYWCFVPVTLRLLGRPAAEFYGSTWTMNRDNVGELLALFDKGRIRKATVLTGTYFKRRESAVATTLIEGLQARRQRYVAFQNHTKVMLLHAEGQAPSPPGTRGPTRPAIAPAFIVMEGSANFTANPRLEQTVLSNDRGLYEFHRAWMEDILK